MHQTRTMRLLLEDHGKSKQASKQTNKQTEINQHQQTVYLTDEKLVSHANIKLQHLKISHTKSYASKLQQTIHHYSLFIPLCLYDKAWFILHKTETVKTAYQHAVHKIKLKALTCLLK